MSIELFLISILFTKHLLADFVFQGKFTLIDKHKYLSAGNCFHCLIHGLFTFYCVFICLDLCSSHNDTYIFTTALIFAAIDFIVHYHIDFIKAYINKIYNLTPTKHSYWILFGLDQWAHAMTYIGLTFMMGDYL